MRSTDQNQPTLGSGQHQALLHQDDPFPLEVDLVLALALAFFLLERPLNNPFAAALQGCVRSEGDYTPCALTNTFACIHI